MAQHSTIEVKLRRKRSHPTQQDIATALGLGQSTVATALNPEQRHKLQEATVEKVLEYARSVGYRGALFQPESASLPEPASPGRNGGRPTIALVGKVGLNVHGMQEQFNLLVNGFNRYDVQLVPLELHWFDGSVARLWEALSGYNLSCIVLYNIVNPIEAESIRSRVPQSIPIVAVQSSLDDVVSIRNNIEDTFLRMVTLYIAAGFKRLGLLLSPRDPGVIVLQPGWTLQSRMRGFMAAVHNAGGHVASDPEVLDQINLRGLGMPTPAGGSDCVGNIYYHVRPSSRSSWQEHGYIAGSELIAKGDLPEVMFCGNDDIAFGFLSACMDHGVRVPEDICLHGCEDTPWACFSPTPMSTLRHAHDALVKETTRVVIDIVEGRADPQLVYEKYFPIKVVMRASSGKPERFRKALAGLPASYARTFVFEDSQFMASQRGKLA